MTTPTDTTPGDARFVHSAAAPWTDIDAGIRRQLLVHGPDLMMVAVDFRANARGAVHHHPHRQATYVAAGRFEVTVGDARRVLETGDAFLAAANVPHGVFALESGRLVDVFTPRRDDFLRAGA